MPNIIATLSRCFPPSYTCLDETLKDVLHSSREPSARIREGYCSCFVCVCSVCVSVCVCVCVCVCLFVTSRLWSVCSSHLASGASVRHISPLERQFVPESLSSTQCAT